MRREHQDGFSLVELLVIMIIIGLLAAIGIPRFLSQRERGFDATALSDLRRLIVVETGLEVMSGLTDDPETLVEDEGWAGSGARVRACAELLGGGADVVLTAWHLDGSVVYTWTRSGSTIEANAIALEKTCPTQTGSLSAKTVWPYSP